MEGKAMKRDKEQYLSWKEFKRQYLSEVKRLAEILGLGRDEIVSSYEYYHPEYHERPYEIDDDYKFVHGVMRCISRCKNKTERQFLVRKLEKSEGAKDVFDEICRIWVFQSYFDDELHFQKIPGYGGRRSEPGKGEIIDIFLIHEEDDTTLINPTAGEDYADCIFPIVVKVKPHSAMTDEDLVRALRDLADSLEADFKNCYLPTSDGYRVIGDKKHQAVLIGLHKNNPALHLEVTVFDFPLDEAVKEAGWVDPNVSFDSGIRELLQKGWPELYDNVSAGKMSPFEALVETGWVHPKDVYEACRNNKKTKQAIQAQEPKDSDTDLPF